jgi:hypothetical protein
MVRLALVRALAISTSFVLASCGPSDTGGPDDPDAAMDTDAAQPIPDAATPDASIPDASPDAGPDSGPDATPCIPLPDGELCNGVDDDCDDEVDEGFPGVGAECDVGVGACERTGTAICTPDGSSTECSAVPGDPSTELCDTLIDEDCDGFVDEGFPSVGQSCTVGLGVCEATGTVVCTPERLDTECDAVPGTPGTELCGTGLDEDCDNFVDEGFPDLGDACTNGVGACEWSGERVCDATGLATECDAVPGLPTGETCNSVDDDCDGTVDDGNPDGGAACDTGEPGVCAAGTETCSGGTIVCQQNVPAGTESCNGLDDDCDGTADDGFNVGDDCDGPDGDECEEGVIQCNTSGGTTCSDNSPNNPELCNGLDEDCDGTIDEGYSLGVACDGSDGDMCEDGVTVCNAAGTGTTCDDPGPAIAESCNGLDDDCDGTIDEGYSLGVACDGSGDTDLCTDGLTVCNAAGTGTTCSDPGPDLTETCNGLDDNCDGSTDEGFGVGEACDSTTDADLCTDGLTVCNAAGNGVVCNDGLPTITELCNGIDDDCDGSTDEGYGLGAACDGTGDTDLCTDGEVVCNAAGTGTVCSDSGPSITESCNGVDDDCDGSTDEGFNVGAQCDGSDGDSCLEGTRSCNAAGTGTVCSDNTTTTFEACNGDAVDEDCDGTTDEGFTLDDNSTCPTFYMGSVAGDTGSGQLSDSYWNEEWDYFTITESNDFPVYLSAQIVLYSPPGVDYDLYVYCQSCGGALIGSSALGGLTGHYDVVYVYNDDDWGTDDEIDVYVEVRYWSSDRCAWWELDVYGNVDVSGTPYGTCNQ